MIKRSLQALVGVILAAPVCLIAQRAELRPAAPIILPGMSDSNSPAHWIGDRMSIVQSFALPLVSTDVDGAGTFKARSALLNTYEHFPLWIESTWVDDNGDVYAWYHTEPQECGSLAAPKIGALISHDGYAFTDLGIIMESAYWPDCNSQNGYFAGGNGDFTVLLDSSRQYFYFYFTNYSGPLYTQGVAVARMAFEDRANPAGRVFKFFQGDFREPGLFGRDTAILPALEPWSSPYADSFWGPSVHWNTFLNEYVMLLNHSCCEPGFPAEGIYVSFNPDLADPSGWTPPVQILDSSQAEWYPQVIGIEPGGTDKSAGEVARFFMKGESHWEIVFSR